MYPPPCSRDESSNNGTNHHTVNNQTLHLPGDICTTIQKSGKHKGTGLQTDSIDSFISLIKLNNTTNNQHIQQLFNTIYQGQIPLRAQHFFTDTYLFCLPKDQNDKSKLCPIGIPSAIRHIIATHIAKQWRDKFALHLLPFNYAVGVPNGMNFIIKVMQLSLDKFIIQPQRNGLTPSRAAVFIDLTNMFNSVSRKELFNIIHTDFPELSPLASLMYEDNGNVIFKYNESHWETIKMVEGVNQGCPLSPIFATLVLHQVLKPLDKQLQERANQQLQNGNPGNDGFGGKALLLSYMDDISSSVTHNNVKFFCEEIDKLGQSRGCFVNPHKTRILTSCLGTSPLPDLAENNPQLASDIEQTIAKYSTKVSQDGSTTPVELTSGFRLLGTPIGSAYFAQQFYDEQLKEMEMVTHSINTQVPDLHTRLKLFTQCISQKLPHLLDSDVLHNHTNDFNNNEWYNWNGHLTAGYDKIVTQFLTTLLNINDPDTLPFYATLICHLNINKGGLGILHASTRAIPDFVLNMMSSHRGALTGFQINKDVPNTMVNKSIRNLFNLSTNNNSQYLKQYHLLLPQISSIACPPSWEPSNRLHLFQSHISTHSARGQIKQVSSSIITGQIYTMMNIEAPDHTHLLPNILSPQMSYPLNGMNQSNPLHQLPNWIFNIAIRRKL